MTKQILVVDDSMSIRETLSKMLTDGGYLVETAHNGRAALQYFESNSADLLITDMNMPEMDGITLVSHVRKMPGKRFMPIIMLTSESLDYKDEAKRAGVSGWISKPYKPDHVLSVVKTILR